MECSYVGDSVQWPVFKEFRHGLGGFKYKPPFRCERKDSPERDTWQSETAGQNWNTFLSTANLTLSSA
ncbi:hypothetical protein OSB04_006102 [Centaurea solstitialis]|uniref:Uncharacterized protein n=1 Tax=Centaurea solstitialis TaxID=347529 RepID=A0AA38WHC8_9ASTR|nr:hypothetical protein OSB04_006102 [Centaurea solstitialis]